MNIKKYSEFDGNIFGITKDSYLKIEKHLKKVFEHYEHDEEDNSLEIYSQKKHKNVDLVFDEIVKYMEEDGTGEIMYEGVEPRDLSIIYFKKDEWYEAEAEIIYPDNPFEKEGK